MNQDSIMVTELCKRFNDFYLDHVSFSVPRGRIVGFIGENGAGKSTTINLILNELRRDSGTIEIFGLDNLEHELDIKEDIGVVFDECNFHDMLTVNDICKMFKGIYKNWDSQLFFDYLERFHLLNAKRLKDFSKGMKMKLTIICALSHKPKLMILDEATSGLDPVVRDEILDLFLDYIQDEEHAIFFSSHIISDIQKVADYVVLIHQGKIIFEEQKDDLIFKYGIIRCGRERFTSISEDDYVISRDNKVSMECLVTDKEKAKQKYKDVVVDSASLEDIMLFYIKGDLK